MYSSNVHTRMLLWLVDTLSTTGVGWTRESVCVR